MRWRAGATHPSDLLDVRGFFAYSGTGAMHPQAAADGGYQLLEEKVSQGVTYENAGQDGGMPWWEATDAALAAGFVGVVLWHFIRVDLGGRQNAEWFGECIGKRGGLRMGCCYGVDVEDDPEAPYADRADLRAGVLEFLHTVAPPQSPFPLCFRYWSQGYASRHNLVYGADFAPHPYWWPSWADNSPGGETPVLIQGIQEMVPGLTVLTNTDTCNESAYQFTRRLWGYQESPLARPVLPDVPKDADVPTKLAAARRHLVQGLADLDSTEDNFPWPI
jgi:hypothetical protein